MCFQLVLQWQVRRSSNLDWTIPLPCQIPCVHPNTPPLAPYTKGGLLLHALVCQSPCQGSRGATTTQAMLEPGAPGGFRPFFYAVLGDFFLDDLLRFPTVFLVPFFIFESLAVRCIGFRKFPAWGCFQYQTNICRRFQHHFQDPNQTLENQWFFPKPEHILPRKYLTLK